MRSLLWKTIETAVLFFCLCFLDKGRMFLRADISWLPCMDLWFWFLVQSAQPFSRHLEESGCLTSSHFSTLVACERKKKIITKNLQWAVLPQLKEQYSGRAKQRKLRKKKRQSSAAGRNIPIIIDCLTDFGCLYVSLEGTLELFERSSIKHLF